MLAQRLQFVEHAIFVQVVPAYPVAHVLQAVVDAHSVQLAIVVQLIFVQVGPVYPTLHVWHDEVDVHKAQFELHIILAQLAPE